MPDDVAAVVRLAEQLRVDPDEIRSYGRRAKTSTDHVRLAAKYLGWRAPTTLELKELDEFLLARQDQRVTTPMPEQNERMVGSECECRR